MPFIKRDENGAISAVYSVATEEGLEEVISADPELLNFLHGGDADAEARRNMLESDLGLIRVLEDLVSVLIENGTIRYTDLPEKAQEKLLARSGLRSEFAYVATLFSSDDEDGIDLVAEYEEGSFL